MRKQPIKNRRVRYGGIAVILTVLLITVTVLANALVGTLASRYGWYGNLLADETFGVSEKCHTLIGAALDAAQATSESPVEVEIVFCDLEENLLQDASVSYVYQTARTLAERDARIKITCYDIWLNPDTVRRYQTTKVIDSKTGLESEQTVALYSTSVIIVCGSYHRVYSNTEFFAFEGGDTSSAWAYSGERKLAAGILRAVAPYAPTVCMTNNHAEVYYDYEILYLLDDAGYRISYLDLSQDAIPAECSLLVCFNPNKDLSEESGVSDRSESDVLNAFLSVPGHSFLFFLENGTPSLPNLEAFLKDWGVSALYHQSGDLSYRYMVQDSSASLTSDGYTIYGKAGSSDYAKEWTAGQNIVFKNATALRPASGYLPNGDGSFSRGERRMYPLYESGSSAVSWANGAAVDGDSVILMSLTEQTLADGKSRVGVVSSVRFATESFLQSAVYGNSDTMFRLLGDLGGTTTPLGLSIKPFHSSNMSLVTTVQKRRWTILLSALPALCVSAVAVPILVRRKYA